MLKTTSSYSSTHLIPFEYIEIHSFVALIAKDYEMQVSFARHLRYFSVACSNFALTSSTLSSVRTQIFLNKFLSTNDAVYLAITVSSWMSVALGTVIPENLRGNFFSTLSSGTIFHIYFVEKNMLFDDILKHSHKQNSNQDSSWF